MDEQNEIENLKRFYAMKIEDGRKVSSFMSLPEFQWFIESAIKPTIETYTKKVMTCKVKNDREDWFLRGVIEGLNMATTAPDGFISGAEDAKKKARELRKAQDEQL